MIAECAAAAPWFLTRKSGIAFWNACSSVAWAPKQDRHALRMSETDCDRMSGSPQASAVRAPPESKADIEPTAAKARSQAVTYARWSAPASVRVSRSSTWSLRPQRVECALKYATKARVACRAEVKIPGTGPVMSEAFAMVMVLSVIPGPLRSRVHGLTVLGSCPGSRCEPVRLSSRWATGNSPVGSLLVPVGAFGADTTEPGAWAAPVPVLPSP